MIAAIVCWGMVNAEYRFTMQTKLDSLMKELKHHSVEDKLYLKILNELTFTYSWMQFDSAGLYADKAILLAKKLNARPELVDAYNNKANFLNVYSKFAESAEYSNMAIVENGMIHDQAQLIKSYVNLSVSYMHLGNDSLCRDVLRKARQIGYATNDLEALAQTCIAYSFYYRTIDINIDSAFANLAKSIELFTGIDDKRQLSMAMLIMGNTYTLISHYDTALIYLEKGIELARETGSNVCLYNAYGTVSVYYLFGKSDYPKAVENLLLSNRYCELAGEKNLLACNLNNLAMALQQTGQFERAIFYLDKQLPISLELNDLYSLSGYYAEYGNVLFKQKKFSEALQKYKEALKISLNMNREDRISECSRSVGDAFEGLQQYDSAFYYFNKGMEASKKINSQYDITINLISMARALKNMPDHLVRGELKTIMSAADKNTKAIEYGEQALELLKKSGEPDLKRNVYQVLSELYEEKNNIPKAYEYFKEYTIYKDSISNTENAKAIAGLQMQYETEKKEQQIAMLNKDMQIQQSEIEKQKSQRNSVMGGMALILMIGGVTWNRYRVKRKTNRQLSEALKKLKDTQQQLIEQEKMASLGQLTAGIAHEIQNPLNFVINFSELSDELMEELIYGTGNEVYAEIVTDLEDNLNKIEHHSERAGNIVKSMLMHARNEGTEKTTVDVNEVCIEAISFAHHTAAIRLKNFQCEIVTELDQHLPAINSVRQELSGIVLNLLNNAYHAVHEKQKGMSKDAYKPGIELSTRLIGNNILIKVFDNGIGIPEGIKNRVFEPFFTTKNTNEGTGLGLSISHDILKNYGGEISVESEPGSFTVFTVLIPIT